jgi:hypothetical protein
MRNLAGGSVLFPFCPSTPENRIELLVGLHRLKYDQEGNDMERSESLMNAKRDERNPR